MKWSACEYFQYNQHSFNKPVKAESLFVYFESIFWFAVKKLCKPWEVKKNFDEVIANEYNAVDEQIKCVWMLKIFKLNWICHLEKNEKNYGPLKIVK